MSCEFKVASPNHLHDEEPRAQKALQDEWLSKESLLSNSCATAVSTERRAATRSDLPSPMNRNCAPSHQSWPDISPRFGA